MLQSLNVPATIFLATSFIGSNEPFPFDDWELKGSPDVSPEAWRPLTFEECERLLAGNLIALGCHTHSHADFRERPAALREDLTLSLAILRRRFDIFRPALSLPYGIESRGFAGPEYYRIAKSLGTTCCLTTEEQVIRVADSPFGWGRFIGKQEDSAATLAVKFDGWRDLVRNCWRRLRGRAKCRTVTASGG